MLSSVTRHLTVENDSHIMCTLLIDRVQSHSMQDSFDKINAFFNALSQKK